jgi:low affinity Fe/Cu permease
VTAQRRLAVDRKAEAQDLDEAQDLEKSRSEKSHSAKDLPKKHWTTHIGQAAGHPAAFVVVMVYALLWLVFDRATFDWNAVATLAVFVMTLFIQRANRRDNLALHAKLDELLRVDHAARSELTQLDEEEPEAIERHRDDELQRGGGC